MGLIRTQLELVNGGDLELCRRKKMPVEEVRKMIPEWISKFELQKPR